MDVQSKKSASDYAKAKVQQIRKKFGYSNNKQNTHQPQPQPSSTKDPQPQSQPNPKTKTTPFSPPTPTPLTITTTIPQAQTQRYPSTEIKAQHYQNRIKNIDVLNKRIADVLKEKDFQLKSYAARKSSRAKDGLFGDRDRDRRRESLGVDRVERGERVGLREGDYKLNLVGVQETKPNLITRPPETSYNYTHRQRQRRPLELKSTNTRQSQGLQLPNSQYTVSIQLKSSPLKKQKEIYAKRSQVEQIREVKQVRQFKQVKDIKQFKEVKEVKDTKSPAVERKITLQTPKPTPKKENIQALVKPQVEREPEPSPTKKQTVKLAQALSEQIERDQKLRYSKWQFSQWTNPNKWQLLHQKLPKHSLPDLQKLFTLSPEQHNPFFESSSQITQSCLQDLLLHYNSSTKYWQQCIKQNASITKLQQEYFSVRDIDLNKKGYLSIEDIVCFVNLYTGKFFRNRDAIGLMRRFGREGKDKEGREREGKDGDGGAGIGDGVKYQRFLDQVTRL